MDRQSNAYRKMPIHDQAQDIELGAWASAEHQPASGLDGIRLPDDYEHDLWDLGREQPKTLDEARGALIDRVLNPTAPDSDESVGVYDVLEG